MIVGLYYHSYNLSQRYNSSDNYNFRYNSNDNL